MVSNFVNVQFKEFLDVVKCFSRFAQNQITHLMDFFSVESGIKRETKKKKKSVSQKCCMNQFHF